jgi:Tol biopolymer transport system component
VIVFDGSRSNRRTQVFPILTVRADGTGERMLTRPQTPDEFPTWSPDGTSILFDHPLGRWGSDGTFHADGRIDLVTMNPEGSGRRKIAQVRNEPDHCACPAWSPDGTTIAYEAAGPSGKPDIYTMNADGSGEIQLTTDPSRDENPDWSPDGTQIAFYSERRGNGQIYLMNADGTNQHRITRDPWYDQAVRWRPG